MGRAARRERVRRGTPPPATPVLEPLLFDLPLGGASTATVVESADESGESSEDDGAPLPVTIAEPLPPPTRSRRNRSAGGGDPAATAVADPEPVLFSVALQPDPAPAAARPRRRDAVPELLLPVAPEPEPEPEATWAPPPSAPAAALSVTPRSAAPPEPYTLVAATARERVAAGGLDLVVHVAVGAATVAGVLAMDVVLGLRHIPAFLVFVAVFSFLYMVVPLVFWGHTPGMAWGGLRASEPGGGPLGFGTTVRRWLGAVATVALAGLPALLLLRGDSLADLLSGSRCYRVAPASRRAR